MPAETRSMRLLACALLLANATIVRAQQRDTLVLALRALVSTALRNNIDLRAASLAPDFAVADLRAARGGFDPTFSVGSETANRANDQLGLSPRSTETSNAFSGTVGALLPTGSQLSLGAK